MDIQRIQQIEAYAEKLLTGPFVVEPLRDTMRQFVSQLAKEVTG